MVYRTTKLNPTAITEDDVIVALATNKQLATRITTLLSWARHFEEKEDDINADLSANLISLIHHADATIDLLEKVMNWYPEITEQNKYIETDLESYKNIVKRFKGIS